MAKGIYVGVNGKARKAKALYVGVDGKARKVSRVYVGVNGKARLAWMDDPWPDALREFSGTLEVSYTHSRFGDARTAAAEVRFVREGNVWSGTAELRLNGAVADVQSCTLLVTTEEYLLNAYFYEAEALGADNSFRMMRHGPVEAFGYPEFRAADGPELIGAAQALNTAGVLTIRMTPFTD